MVVTRPKTVRGRRMLGLPLLLNKTSVQMLVVLYEEIEFVSL